MRGKNDIFYVQNKKIKADTGRGEQFDTATDFPLSFGTQECAGRVYYEILRYRHKHLLSPALSSTPWRRGRSEIAG
jgi:hypothetical protein